MKKTNAKKKLLPAIGMLAISAAMLSTSTFAWFTMNKVVKANSMEVRAVAEEGLLINEVATANSDTWDDVAVANQSSALSLLYPSSTANGTTWYHAGSKKSYSAASATSGTASTDLDGSYSTLSGLTAITAMSEGTAAGNSTAQFSTMGTSATAPAGYYVHYTYYLKGATGSDTTLSTTAGAKNVFIKSVTATTSDSSSADLNKSLRVGIFMKSSGTFYIYAPFTGYTDTYYVNAGSTATQPIASNTATATDLATLPAANKPGTPVEVYIWYEGEDVNCKSDNAAAASLDKLSVEIQFELKEVPTT